MTILESSEHGAYEAELLFLYSNCQYLQPKANF